MCLKSYHTSIKPLFACTWGNRKAMLWPDTRKQEFEAEFTRWKSSPARSYSMVHDLMLDKPWEYPSLSSQAQRRQTLDYMSWMDRWLGYSHYRVHLLVPIAKINDKWGTVFNVLLTNPFVQDQLLVNQSCHRLVDLSRMIIAQQVKEKSDRMRFQDAKKFIDNFKTSMKKCTKPTGGRSFMPKEDYKLHCDYAKATMREWQRVRDNPGA